MSALKLPPFEYYEPVTVAEATTILATHGDGARVLAGGADLLPRMRAGTIKADHVVNIQRVPDLDYKRRLSAGGIEFGAMASLHSLEMWSELVGCYPALYDAMHQITSVQTKCMGTAVGNICVATPASDVAPALAAYDAQVVISGPDGTRRMPMAGFYPAYGCTALARGEFVTGVEVPALPVGHGAGFFNLVRTHADIAKVTVTAAVVLEGEVCTQARIALGSVAPTMIRARGAEALLEGNVLTDDVAGEASVAAAGEARPITDLRSTEEYRREMVAVLVGRALHKAAERARLSLGEEVTA